MKIISVKENGKACDVNLKVDIGEFDEKTTEHLEAFIADSKVEYTNGQIQFVNMDSNMRIMFRVPLAVATKIIKDRRGFTFNDLSISDIGTLKVIVANKIKRNMPLIGEGDGYAKVSEFCSLMFGDESEELVNLADSASVENDSGVIDFARDLFVEFRDENPDAKLIYKRIYSVVLDKDGNIVPFTNEENKRWEQVPKGSVIASITITKTTSRYHASMRELIGSIRKVIGTDIERHKVHIVWSQDAFDTYDKFLTKNNIKRLDEHPIFKS